MQIVSCIKIRFNCAKSSFDHFDPLEVEEMAGPSHFRHICALLSSFGKVNKNHPLYSNTNFSLVASFCFLLSFFCDNENLQAYLFFIVIGHKDGGK